MTEFTKTIHLPSTSFSMKANLVHNEEKWIKFWEENTVSTTFKKENTNNFILHDGPPYANGHLHLGHALNKILKDIICRAYIKLGFNVDYIPGWDCHGLPIEWKVEEKYRKSGKNKDEIDQIKFRDECRKFAASWVEIQCDEFKRLGISCDWEKKYTTMTNESESIIVSEFLKFLEDGRLYLGHKPVMWSVVEKTALAEAEVEYQEKKSTSIYVKFPIRKSNKDAVKDASIIIWTTTPWTLPGNRAIAFSEKLDYKLILFTEDFIELNIKKNEKIIFEKKLLKVFFEKYGVENYKVLDEFKGDYLEKTFCEHPLKKNGFNFLVPLLSGEHVTDETGSGFVHIAPGHGLEDFEIGKKFGLEIPKTVENNGTYSANVPFFSGKHIFKVEKEIVDKLNDEKMLLCSSDFNHSYPHSWRSKAPLIYRATSQWFISMKEKDLRESALKAIDKVNWIPKTSKNRILSMVSERPDWCVSRQRSWGVPITIFVNNKTGEPLIDKEVNKRIVSKVYDKGTDIWFSGSKELFLGSNYNLEEFEKVTDILDVWFDSGSSHAFVLKNRGIKEKSDLYLEGSDQHRGWFQSSLLESCAIYGDSPFKTVLTHGFVLDEKGKKMSKSMGNVISPEDVIKKYGADILRLWVSTSNYNEDLKISYQSLDRQTEIYRKIRNSLRFLLGNLKDWNNKEIIEHEELPLLEKYIRHEIYKIHSTVIESFKKYNFHKAFQLISSFCNNELSSFFFDIRKDVLYCDPLNSKSRFSSRTVMVDIFKNLINWLSPVLAFTSEEAWQCWKKEIQNEEEKSCHEVHYKKLPEYWKNNELEKQWGFIKVIRKAVSYFIEKKREQKIIKSSLEAKPYIYLGNKNLKQSIIGVDLKEILITSDVQIVDEKGPGFETYEEDNDIAIKIELFDGVKCNRCWKIFKFNGQSSESFICKRCKDAINTNL